MLRLILTIMVVILTGPSSFAGDKAAATFTNQDLMKYDKPSDSKPSLRDTPINNNAVHVQGVDESGPVENEPVRHVIPYSIKEGMEMSIIVPVTFNNSLTDDMLLDTGASGMHISMDLADKLGLFKNEEGFVDVVMGVGGAVPVIVTIIETIKIGDVEYEFIPTTISRTKFRNFKGLLGMDFMTNYAVHIDNQNREVVFEERPENIDMPAGRSETWWRVTYRMFRNMKAKWKDYRNKLHSESRYSSQLRDMKKLADRQYDKADDLLTRLDVYAGTHSVPMEWR